MKAEELFNRHYLPNELQQEDKTINKKAFIMALTEYKGEILKMIDDMISRSDDCPENNGWEQALTELKEIIISRSQLTGKSE